MHLKSLLPFMSIFQKRENRPFTERTLECVEHISSVLHRCLSAQPNRILPLIFSFLLSILKEIDFFLKTATQCLKNCYHGFFRIKKRWAWRWSTWRLINRKSSFYSVSLTLGSGEMLIVVDLVLCHWPVNRMALNGGFQQQAARIRL